MEGIQALQKLGCCPRCVLVHNGVKDMEHYTSDAAVMSATAILATNSLTGLLGGDPETTPQTMIDENTFPTDKNIDTSNGNTQNDTCPKDGIAPICVSCLGLLQTECYSQSTIEKICQPALNAGYDAASFSLNVSMPVCLSLRAHLVSASYTRVTDRQPFKEKREGAVGLIKDAWKNLVCGPASEVLGKTWNSQEGLLTMPVTARYGMDNAECLETMKALNYKGPALKAQRNRRQKQYKYTNNSSDAAGDVSPATEDQTASIARSSGFRCSTDDAGQQATYSRQAIEAVLSGMKYTELLAHCPWPAAPTEPITLEPETPSRAPVFVAGRYCKLSRELSQTPWLIGGELKCEFSVEQLIAKEIMPALGAEELKFLSSGREDVDVRCLGRGRPFALEVLDPKQGSLEVAALAILQQRINSSTADISVHHLQMVDRENTNVLRYNTEDKVKSYCAMCLVRGGGLTDDLLQRLEGLAPILLQQQTPIRVLHRRPLLTRPRTLYQMTATRLTDTFFKVHVRTEAGTYIKELVHGDFGRTTPSLSSLLGREVDILALDVEDVELDWPSPVTS